MFADRLRFRFHDVVALDPMSALVIGTTVAGGALSAGSTLAGGAASKTAGQLQKQADEYKAKQAEQNAGLAVAAAQTRMFDTQQKSNLLQSTSTARASASGVDAGTGSAVENVGEIAKRGSYLAALDLFNGQSQATGLLNEAKGYRYSGDIAELEGEEKEKASYLAAGGQLVGSFGSAFGNYANPRSRLPSPS